MSFSDAVSGPRDLLTATSDQAPPSLNSGKAPIRRTLALLAAFVAALPLLRAASTPRPLASLPASVYLLTEPIPGGTQGNAAIYEVTRGGRKLDAVFASKATAEAFLAALPDAAQHQRAASMVPRSFLKEVGKMGGAFLLDPISATDGGTPIQLENPPAADNPELKAICDADQADRRPAAGAPIDWQAVGPRDAQRLARVRELYRAGKLGTGGDYFRAALVLQHGSTPEDYLLAHDLAVAAVQKGHDRSAAWLAAASEDRFLQSIGRKQRFGTQLTVPIVTDGEITDALRDELNVPPLPVRTEKPAPPRAH